MLQWAAACCSHIPMNVTCVFLLTFPPPFSVCRHIHLHCNTLQHTATRCNTLQHAALHCNTLQNSATHCNTLQHTASHGNTLQQTVHRCNTLQHTATHYNTLQHTATHCRLPISSFMQICEYYIFVCCHTHLCCNITVVNKGQKK